MNIIEVKKKNRKFNQSIIRSMGRFGKSNTYIFIKPRNRKYKKMRDVDRLLLWE